MYNVHTNSGEDAATCYNRCVMCDKTLKSGESADFLVEAANAIRKVNTAGNDNFI